MTKRAKELYFMTMLGWLSGIVTGLVVAWKMGI